MLITVFLGIIERSRGLLQGNLFTYLGNAHSHVSAEILFVKGGPPDLRRPSDFGGHVFEL